jgi:hypothetical protein
VAFGYHDELGAYFGFPLGIETSGHQARGSYSGGGGKNVARMLERASEGRVCVEKTSRLNRRVIHAGRSEIRLGSVSENPWPDFVNDLREVRRVLKPGGRFFICNEMNKLEEGEASYQHWIKKLNPKTYTSSEFQK